MADVVSSGWLMDARSQMQERSPSTSKSALHFSCSLFVYAARLKLSQEPPRRKFGPVWQYWHSGREVPRYYPPLAEEMGPMPVTALRGTGLNNPCALFQVGGAGSWYAISNGQQGFDLNFSLLLTAATTGQQILSWVNGQTVCNAQQVNWVEFGVE